LSDLQVKSAQESADRIRAICHGVHGPDRDIVLLNAAAALYAGDAVPSLSAGLEMARIALDNGAAARTLARFVALTHADAV
jgi:anthranilate phosphoribosyltransferase